MTPISGKTKLVGLLGWPVEHTLSPPMQNAAFEAAGLDWTYVPLPTAPESLETALRGLVSAGFCGLNATIPHKEAIIPLLDEVAEEARAIGAVNTVAVREGQTCGFNTDVDGFVNPVSAEAKVDLKGQTAVVLGAGGASRAIVAGCLRMGVTRLTLTDIDLPKAEKLLADMAPLAAGCELKVVEVGSEPLREATAASRLVANATPLGMHGPDETPIDLTWLPDGVVAFDAVYTQPQTALMRAAVERGGKEIHGLRMLLHQGAKAFELWTGQRPDVEVMQRALEEARQ